jgi:antitoxin (DNA-binding transcriptional repressor) of toxin-antitoxin stability system
MATIHIPEAEATRDFAAVMAHVDEGSEVVIERDARAVAVVRPLTKQPA